jgi:chemotaxis protein CheX
VKAKYINPFLNASINLFKEYLGVDLTPSAPYLNINPQNLLEVSAIIGLAGETVGAVVLSFSRDTAVKVVSRLAGKTYQALSKEVIDGVGELVNILAGNAKKDMEEYRLHISLPGVITGNSYRINWPQNVPVITIPFQSSMGDITVNVSLREEQRK